MRRFSTYQGIVAPQARLNVPAKREGRARTAGSNAGRINPAGQRFVKSEIL
jgi:hypothetical protein